MKPRRLSDKEIQTLGDKIIDTSANIYTTAKEMFPGGAGVEVDDATFDRLRALSKMFRCEECSQWLPLSLESPNRSDCCCECEE